MHNEITNASDNLSTNTANNILTNFASTVAKHSYEKKVKYKMYCTFSLYFYCIKTEDIGNILLDGKSGKNILTVCSYHVTYVFKHESTLYSCLNVKELLDWSSLGIGNLSDCIWTQTHNHLDHKRRLNRLVKLAKCVFAYELSGCGFESSCGHLKIFWLMIFHTKLWLVQTIAY